MEAKVVGMGLLERVRVGEMLGDGVRVEARVVGIGERVCVSEVVGERVRVKAAEVALGVGERERVAEAQGE